VPVRTPEILQVEIPHSLGALTGVLRAIAKEELVLEHVSGQRNRDRTLWEIAAEIDPSAKASVVDRLKMLPVVRFMGRRESSLDDRGGKIEIAVDRGNPKYHAQLADPTHLGGARLNEIDRFGA
jgi:hypothetical protein